jgi:integrase
MREPGKEPDPILWQNPTGGRWYILHGRGLKQKFSTGLLDRDAAEQELASFKEGRRLGATVAAGGGGTTVGEILDGYEAEKRGDVRAPDGIKYAVSPLKAHLGRLMPHQLIRPVIRGYADFRSPGVCDLNPQLKAEIARAQAGRQRLHGRVRNGTILKEIGVLRAALEWGVECGLIPGYPRISNPVKTPKAAERWLTRDEARQLLRECVEPHLRCFVMLGLMTAARAGAIVELLWERVLWSENFIDYGEGHGNKHRAVVPMNPELRKFLDETMKPLACSPNVVERYGKPISEIKNGFRAACQRAGIKGATPNTLRHTAATWMSIAGVPMREIARVLGDSEATTEKVYAKYSPNYLRSATGALGMKPQGSFNPNLTPPELLLQLEGSAA